MNKTSTYDLTVPREGPDIPMVIAASPTMRKLWLMADDDAKDKLRGLCQLAVREIDGDPQIKDSLINPIAEGFHQARQIDLRPAPDAPIALKMFVKWGHHHNCWMVMVEAADETYFEDKAVPRESLN